MTCSVVAESLGIYAVNRNMAILLTFKAYFFLHGVLYIVHRCNSAPIARLSSITLFACIVVLHFTTNDNSFFPDVQLESHPIHLISNPGIEAAFLAHIFSIMTSLLARSMESMWTACATMPKVPVIGFAPLSKTSVQQSFIKSFLVSLSFTIYTAILLLFSLQAAQMSVSVMFFVFMYWLMLLTISFADWLSKAWAAFLLLNLTIVLLALLYKLVKVVLPWGGKEISSVVALCNAIAV